MDDLKLKLPGETKDEFGFTPSQNKEIEEYLSSLEDVVFIVFHAGLGQDISYPYLDPTVYDLKSAYLEESMFKDKKTNTIVISPAEILDEKIYTGVLLPETQNIIYFDVVEDIFYGSDDLCDIQIGLTGIFAFLLGYELGLPPMFNNDSFSINYGDPGVGYFGLMDHGSNNGRGVIPVPPNPWTRSIIADWSEVINIDTLTNTDFILVEAYNTSKKIYKIAISEDEYFLIENRNNHIISNYDIEFLQYLLWDDYLCEKCSINCSGLDIVEIENRRDSIEVCLK